MSLKSKIDKNLIEEIKKLFPDYSLDTKAPQGQNDFSRNIILEKNNKKTLLKVINLKKIFKGNENQVEDEINSLKNINSPFVIKLLNVYKTKDFVFMEFPFLEGKNLREYSSTKKLSKDEIKNIGISLLRGISDLSRSNVVHQDIKPENIMITIDGEIKIVDLGSVRFNKSYFKGKTKTNKNYSAPEQIAGDKATLVEELRINCDEKFDVYAAGIILYELITGMLPYSSNENKLKNTQILPIEQADFTDDFKKVILTLLNHSPRHRPLASEAIVFIENEKVTLKLPERGQFYYSSTNADTKIEKVLSLKDNSIDGVILNASQTLGDRISKYRFSKIKKILDPQLYLIQFEKAQNKNFKKLPYFNLCIEPKTEKTDISILQNKSVRNKIIDETLNYQLKISPDIILSPSLHIKDFSDEAWTLDQELTQETLSIYNERDFVIPIFKSVILGQDILTTSKSRGKILDYLKSSAIKNFNGYFILLESSEEVFQDENWIMSAKNLIVELLATGKPVIFSRAPTASLIFSYLGVSLGMGENQSQRHFFLNTEDPTPKTKSSLMYIPKIFSRIKTPSSLFSLNNKAYQDLATCKDECCKHVNFSQHQNISELDRYVHFIYNLSKQFKKYSPDKSLIVEDLNNAQRIITSLKNSTDFIVKGFTKNELKPQTPSFIDVWLSCIK